MDDLDKAVEDRSYRMVRTHPPGRTKITNALKSLLMRKEFGAITISEIAEEAGVTEALLYKYFKDKRDLLHQVLSEYLEVAVSRIRDDLKETNGVKQKIRRIIWRRFDLYLSNRIFARILLIEARSLPGHFQSKTYQKIREYSRLNMEVIREGMESGELRDDIEPEVIRQVLMGSVEHTILPVLIFNREASADILTENLCKILFNGIEKHKA